MSEGIIHAPDVYSPAIQVGLEKVSAPLVHRTDDIIQSEAAVNPILIQENVVFDSKKMEAEFRDCLESGRNHIEFPSSKYPEACSKPLHLNLLEAISETEY